MKNLFRNLAVFIFLAIFVSAMVGCPDTKATKNASDPKVNESTKTGETKTDRIQFPPAPAVIADAKIELIDGGTFNLKENKGKVVLINLWAIWCGPCIQEMPHLNELEEQYKDKGLVVIGLNTGNDIGEKETKANIDKFVAKQDLKYKIGWVDRPVLQQFFNMGQKGGVIPQSFLFNRNGEWVGVFQGGSPRVIMQMKENVDKFVNAE